MKNRKILKSIIGFLLIVVIAFIVKDIISWKKGVNFDKNIKIPSNFSSITKTGNYSLDCKSNYYTNITIGGSIIPESSISVSKGNEQQVLYVQDGNAKYFGADYTVLQDDGNYLVIARLYDHSGLSEVVSVHKETGIGFDTKTSLLSISGAPNSTTYNIICGQI